MSAPGQAVHTCRLWSLWDFMNKIDIGAITLGMKLLAPIAERWLGQGPRQLFDAHQFEAYLEAIAALRVALFDAQLPVSAHYAIELENWFRAASFESDGRRVIEGKCWSYVTENLSGLVKTLPIEANQRWFMSIGSDLIESYLQSEPLLGREVEAAFADTSYDITEAGKCLALERSTAAVFHLMRAMETAVRVLGEKIGATTQDSKGETLPWGVIVANIKSEIDKLPKGPDQDEWYKLHALLHSVNRSFRTKTAHPAAKYTQEEAKNVLSATKAFFQEMVTRVGNE